MTDRELLEYAAKAAGIEFSVMGGGARYDPKPNMVQPYVPWNPLTDDGDALRLAVKLGLCILLQPHYVMVYSRGNSVRESDFTDPYAATRRAISCAAAEIGRAMP